MKTARKAILIVLCAVMLVAGSVMGTLAYFTDSEAVTNTFSVGKVGLSMSETKVDQDGKPVEGVDRVQTNTYKLMPGQSYTKDPVVYVDADSEDAWIFVEVENGIAAYEAATVTGGYTNIAGQILANGWTALSGVDGVYYKAYTKNQADENLKVFEEFRVADHADSVANWASIAAGTNDIKVTAYAIQMAGFENQVDDAWSALKNQLN